MRLEPHAKCGSAGHSCKTVPGKCARSVISGQQQQQQQQHQTRACRRALKRDGKPHAAIGVTPNQAFNNPGSEEHAEAEERSASRIITVTSTRLPRSLHTKGYDRSKKLKLLVCITDSRICVSLWKAAVAVCIELVEAATRRAARHKTIAGSVF